MNIQEAAQEEIELENSGMASLIERVEKKNGLISTKSIKQEHFTSVIKNVQQIKDNFFWQANIGDLWRLLNKYLLQQQIRMLFENDRGSIKVIEAICISIRLVLHKRLADWYIKKYPLEEKACEKLKQVINSSPNNITLSEFSQSLIFKEVIKPTLEQNNLTNEQFVSFLRNYEQVFCSEGYQNFQIKFLDFILGKVRASPRKKTTIGYSIKLIVLYLRISIENKCYYRLFMSNFNLSQTFLNFLVKPKGIITILRMLEDSISVDTIRKEYEFTKNCLKKDNDEK